jgi:hypothetical protein
MTDAQIDELLVLLNAPHNGTPTSYKFVMDFSNEYPKEIEDFKKNWVAEQGR